MRLLLTGAALLLLAPAIGHGQAAPGELDITADRDVQRALAAAAAYWRAGPACSVVVSRVEMADDGAADAAACRIRLSASRFPSPGMADYPRRWVWVVLCDTLVHESGHLLGHAHGPAVMAHLRRGQVQVCRDAFLPLPSWARARRGIARLYQDGELGLACAAYARRAGRHARRPAACRAG